jgi:hypothetical protein
MATDLHPSHPHFTPRFGRPRGLHDPDRLDRDPPALMTIVNDAAPGRLATAKGSAWSAGGAGSGLLANLAFVAAAAALAVSGLIHLHLWNTGYRQIPTIGPLFLAQAIVGMALAAVLVLVRRIWVAALAFGFVCATIAGFLMACYVGLFGFRDSWSAPFAGMAFAVEVSALVLAAAGSALCLLRRRVDG